MITEDDPRWDPATMGNQRYGQGVTKRASSLGLKRVGPRKLNKAKTRAGGAARAGKAYVTVTRADGRYGHDYGNGNIVWLKPKNTLKKP